MSDNKGGRPTRYTKELADLIIDEYSNGKYLKHICAEIGINRSTLRDWRNANKSFRTRLLRARKEFADSMFEDINIESDQQMSDAIHCDLTRDAIDKVKAIAAMMSPRNHLKVWSVKSSNPKKYGDRQEIKQKTEAKHEIVDNSATAKLFERLSKK